MWGMTMQEARERLERVRSMADDDEVAHIEEDDFRRYVLREIAGNSIDPLARVLASTALQTEEIKFARWCA
jgi:hypothetical protein